MALHEIAVEHLIVSVVTSQLLYCIERRLLHGWSIEVHEVLSGLLEVTKKKKIYGREDTEQLSSAS